MIELAVLIPVVVAVLSGGVAGELVRWFRMRQRDEVDNLAAFYPTWRDEMERLHSELALMRVDILKLSAEVRRLGGDPLAVRYGGPYREENP